MSKQSASNVILITGASAGTGLATAKQLSIEDQIVWGAVRRTDKTKDLVDLGGHTLALDVTDEAQKNAAVDHIVSEQGRNVLINNADYSVYGSAEDVSHDDARRQFKVNFFGAALLTQEVLPHIRKRWWTDR